MTDATMHLRALIVRRDYLRDLQERRGYDKWRAFDILAIEWALDHFREPYAEDFTEAERQAAGVIARRAQRQQGTQP